jgi:putative heme-binding domain-containing protein
MRWFAGLVALVLAQDGNKKPSFPTCPKDWKLEVVAQIPHIEHPSVVTCAPDGRIFLGQDPMDMRGPTNKPADSIVCIHPDGRVTEFATRLHAVYGMLYMDGKLYVHHCPKLSVFTDDGSGVGKDRVDLLECTNPEPTQGGFNDHLPSQIRMGMDGYLYITTGDKGIYGCVGKDGRKLELRGGGIFRMRPDGTELEVYASGTRNHLDVAITDEDEMFTYDNTDDGLGWWTRVTHMVDGGFYGYPWDYKPRRPYTLWMMTDYQGGSGCGALCYTEDALPEEYHNNLFFCEWARSQLLRLKVERDGASFKVASRENFSTGPGDFRPLGLGVSPDGLSLYLTDWNYGGWTRPIKAGRLLKYTYTGKSRAKPKPDWFVDAAMGRTFKATTAELIEALSHPAKSVRLVAQRRLVDRKAVEELKAVRGAPARWHAIWALDALGVPALDALKDPDARAQAARQLGTRRVKEATEPLVEMLSDPNPVLRFRAATALGRIGNPKAVPALLKALDEKDFFTRYAVFKALNRIGAWTETAKGLESDNARIREGTLFAMRDAYDLAVVTALAQYVGNILNPGESRALALSELADLMRQEPPWDGKWWSIQPAATPRPARTIDWEGTPKVQEALRDALSDTTEAVRRVAIENAGRVPGAAKMLRELFERESGLETRRLILRSLGALKDAESGELVASILKDPSSPLLVEAVSIAGKIGGPAVAEALTSLLKGAQSPDILIPALQAAGSLKVSAPAVVKHVASENSKVCVAAVNALAQIGGDTAVEALLPLLDDERRSVRRSAVTALGALQARSAIPQLLKAVQDKGTHNEAIEALAKMPDVRALDAYLDGLGGKSASARDAARRAIAAIQKEALPLIEKKIDSLPAAVVDELQKIYQRAFGGAKKPDLESFAMANKGDVARGKALFMDPQGMACAKCHKVGGEGGQIGPDLSSVGAKYGRDKLIESVLKPSAQILDGYQQTMVFTRDGQDYRGVVRSESADELVLVDAQGNMATIKKSEIKTRKLSDVSLMPDGLANGLTPQEFADLIEYLESLR